MRFAVFAACLLLAARPSEACEPEYDGIEPHELDPVFADDAVAPATPQADFSIARGDSGGGGCAGTTCGGKYARITIDVVSTDDRTPTDRLGYILTITGGDKPQGLYSRFQDGAPVFQPEGELAYGFDYDDETFEFDVEVRTVDLNGNVSEPAMLHIALDEGGGCSISGQRSEWLVLPVLLFALRRRRRC